MSIWLSFAACHLPPANTNTPSKTQIAEQANIEADRKKAEADRHKAKAEEYGKLCHELRTGPLKERNANGSVWVMSAEDSPYLHGEARGFYNSTLVYQTEQLWRETKSNSIFEAKSLLCILVQKSEARTCRYQPFGQLHIMGVTTSVSFVDVESKEKVGDTKFVSVPACPETQGFTTKGDATLHGTEATKEEIIGWAKQHWSP